MADTAAATTAPTWDLSDLYSGADDPALAADLDRAEADAKALGERFRGRLAACGGDELAELVAAYEGLSERIGRVYSFASLRFAAQRDDAEIGRFFQGVQERINGVTAHPLFATL